MAVEQTNARAGDLPVYLLGHSMGGLITALYSARNPEGLAGLILSSPGLGIAVEIPAWKRVAGRVLSKVLPTFALPTDLDSALLSHDPASVAAYDQDPLIFKSATARWYTEFIAAQQNLRERASSMHLPLLLLVAGGDKIVDPKASLAFYEAYGTDPSILELDRYTTAAYLLGWLPVPE